MRLIEELVMNILEGKNLVKVYGESNQVYALRNVDFSLPKGQFVAIMGPSGSGKSTLMHMLAGLDKLSSGEVYLNGKNISDMNDKELTLLRRNEIGFIFQSFNLLPMFSAKDNIEMPMTLASKKVDKKWLDFLLKLLGIEDRITHRPSELSGGQQQRVAIARALINKPQIIFADEPTGNLDSASSAEVLQLLSCLVEKYGQTVLMVTHDPVAASYANRVLILEDGEICEDLIKPSVELLSKIMTRGSKRKNSVSDIIEVLGER